MNVAVIGTGMMGFYHARTYSTLNNVNLIAVCDTNKDTGEKVASTFGAKYYSDHRELIKNEKIDAVSIAVPTHLHKEVALDFINHGIHVLIEKPLAVNAKDAKEIADQAKKKQVKLLVGHIERHNPAVAELEKIIKLGILGDIFSIVVKRVGIYPPKSKDTNVVIDLAVHDIDIISTILEKTPNSVFARGGSMNGNHSEDHAEIFLNYGNAGCFIQTNWITPVKIRSLAITGTKGYIELNYITQKINLYQLNQILSIEKYKIPKEFNAFISEIGDSKKTEISVKIEEPLKLEIINFLEAIENKRPLKVTPEEGIRALIISEAILQSTRQQKEIKLT